MRGAILLEVLLSVALLIAAGVTILGLVSQASASVERARDRALAIDLARSAMAEIEAGIATPETMSGPVEASGRDGDERGAPGTGVWGLEVESEPSQFAGLTLVRVRAIRYASAGSDAEEMSVTLRQLLKLSDRGGSDATGTNSTADAASAGAEAVTDEASGSEQAPRPARRPAGQARPPRRTPGGG